MNKKLLFFLFFLLLFPKLVWADALSFCKNNSNQSNITNLDQVKLKNIEVTVSNHRGFAVNSIRILIGNFRFIPDKYKRWYKAKIKANFENDVECVFDAKIKFHGDQKDHVALKDNSITQSLDVHLRQGNIYGITKFILLLKDTRGNVTDAILLSELLRQYNYLAPRTMLVEAKVNDVSTQMIFQEKAVKELLEYNLRRDGPIFEGDERYLWRLAQQAPSNQLSNHAAGLVPLIKKGFNSMLAKQNNTNFIPKSKKHALMSFNALSNLNVSYLLYSNMYNVSKTNYYETYRYYTLNNHLLGLYEPDNILKLDVFNLLIQSATGYHGMVPNNRKFYWNSIENFFEPVNYDSKFNLDAEPQHLLLPVSSQIMSAFKELENFLDRTDIVDLKEKINLRGVNLNINKTEAKIKKLKNNLSKLKDIYLNYDKEIIEHNSVNKINSDMWNKYFESIKKVNPDVILVKQNLENNSFKACEQLVSCNDQGFSDDQISDLLDGDLVINDIEYQYIGKNTEINDLLINTIYKKVKFMESYFYFDENINYLHDKEKNEFNIFQKKPGARAFFYKGLLKDISINFYGYENEIKKQPPNYPIDQRGLTGCLSLINLNVQNVNLSANNSSCEDSVNIINVKGLLDKINIKNSFSDGLDIDFSNVEINDIDVSLSANDCVDFSAGNYKLNKLKLIDCGDKALSVGEKSYLELNEIFAENSNIGIASKDSSITKLNTANLKNLKTCISAYNKKQEFFGGLIEIKKFDCENYYKKTDSDSVSQIILENKTIKTVEYGPNYNFNEYNISGDVNLLKHYPSSNSDETINVVIEISSGKKEKWEVSKISGDLVRDFYMGKPRTIEYSPYPTNYGMIPSTVLPIRFGGDGDPLDVVVLDKPLKQGDVIKARVIGMIKLTDFGEQDDKIVAVPISSNFIKSNSLDELNIEHPEMMETIKLWFENYKGKNLVKFISYGTSQEATDLVKASERYFNRYGIRPR